MVSLAEPRRARYNTAHCFGGLSNRIGHDPFDGDAEASVVGEDGFQVGDGAACFLIGKDAYRDVFAVAEHTPARAAAFAGVWP